MWYDKFIGKGACFRKKAGSFYFFAGKRKEGALPGLPTGTGTSQTNESARVVSPPPSRDLAPEQRTRRIQAKRAELEQQNPDEGNVIQPSEAARDKIAGPEEKLDPAEFLAQLRSAAN